MDLVTYAINKKYTDKKVSELSEEIEQYKTVTPQMFGAVADGVADDTVAVQTALDTGNVIYFPPGRYKVTSQLTCTRSCKIIMCKPYPIIYGADYPLTSADNWMGARIETYTSDEYGMLIGDGVQIDGLYMRAMKGFSGVLFKCDGHLGCRTYPSQIRLSHMQLDCAYYNIAPVSMFDFVPNASYFAILDDICIGSQRGRQFCGYGFRSILDGAGGWGNSMRINNMCIDILADYPLYLDGNGLGMCNWVFENLAIQVYPYKPDDPNYLYRTGHVNVITLKNVQEPLFLGCHIWDLPAATVTGNVIYTENIIDGISCFGCNKPFDDVETVLKGKLKDAADNLNLKNLAMNVSTVEETGANRLILSDGNNEKTVDIPAATASDAQIASGVANWLEVNAKPKETVGRNKFNPYDFDTINASYTGAGVIYYQSNMTCSNYIEAAQGAIVGFSKAGKDATCYQIVCFDADKNFVGLMSGFASAAPKEITVGNTAYIRVVWTSQIAAYADRTTAKIMVTVNDKLNTDYTDRIYEPYRITYSGGLGDFVIIQSPNGTQYQLSVTDDGTLIAKLASFGGEDDEEEIITDVVWRISDRTAVKATYAEASYSRTIDIGTYIYGVTAAGSWNGNKAPTVTLDDENFTLETATSGNGIGVPYVLTPWSTYRISFDTDAKARAHIAYYDDTGVFCENETILPNDSPAGSYTYKFVVKPYAHLVFTFAGNPSSLAKFSNIVLEYVPPQ